MNKEEALNILRDLHEESLFSVRTALETIVPELKESEDEKIRKDIRQCIKLCSFVPSNGTTKDEMFAWLKKQVSPDMVADAYLRGCNDTEKKWLEKRGKCETDCPQNHQDVNHPNGCITMEDFNGGEGFYKLNIEYLNKRQVEEIEEIVRTWNKDADCELCTSKDYCISIEKPITIGKCKLTGKAAELAKEVTPESLEEAKEKLNAEEKLNQRLNQEIQGWWENSEHMDSLWCTVKDAIELTARHFFELGFESMQKVLTEKDIKMIDILCIIFEVSNGYYKVDKLGQYAIRAEEILDWLKSFKRKLL